MNTFKRLSHIAFLLLIFLLLSCQGSTNREWRVNNASSTTIQVRAVLVLGTDSIYESIETGETRIIIITSEPRANSDPQQAYEVFSSFLVTNANGDTIEKDFTNNDNWEIYIEHTKHRPDHFDLTYTLIVKDEDF
ncbi:MAG: hypothetical protein HQ565_06545 [Bacteroidetes bacterium]|nr:hypothetical protein [Bacteroidota bacterium]